MAKLRKYDKTNKRNIAIVSIISLVILISFFFFINKVIETGKKSYTIDANSVLYDADKNMLTLESTGEIKVKWSGNYYLKYSEEDIELAKQVVVYNNATKIINLYGTIYQINSDESVITLEDETIVEDTIIPKFYKLADRKYLIIADTIKNEDESFVANDYLIIELDKLGNATLTNNKVNMKTLTATKLYTSLFTFDIANEILYFSSAEINLKQIIGSTNLYESEEESTIESTEDGSGGSGSGTGDGEGTGSGDGETNETEEENSTVIIDNKVYQDKNFSVIKNTIGTNYLEIDYSIYDPQNEYRSVYLELENNTTKSVETYYLAKNGTNLKLSKLSSNTTYNLTYKYTYLDSTTGEILTSSFDNSYSITTTSPEVSIDVTKLTSSTVSYIVTSSDSSMYEAKVELYLDDSLTDTYTFTSTTLVNSYTGSFDISSHSFNYITLKVTKVNFEGETIDTDVYIRVKN